MNLIKRRPAAAMIVAMLGLFIGLGGIGLAANGQNVILGKPDNTASLKTGLIASVDDKALQVTNTNSGVSATALGLSVAPGRPPIIVSSGAGKATNLNADLLDSHDSSYFLAANGKAANAEKLDGFDSTYFLTTTGKAADADRLDGLDSSGFWKLGGNAGTTATSFFGTTDFRPLTLTVNGERALRLAPTSSSNYPNDTPNVIGGSPGNKVLAFFLLQPVVGATIAGGGQVESSGANSSNSPNVVTDDFGTVGGGLGNRAGDNAGTLHDVPWATAAGGVANEATGMGSSIGGGVANDATGFGATVPGGAFNQATGADSFIAGGANNTASGGYSFAAGKLAKATQEGSFVWGDTSAGDATITSPAANTFTVRAAGGIWLGKTSSPSIPSGRFIQTSTGAYLSNAGAWTSVSDRALKRDFRRLDHRSVLKKIAGMPISSWSYKAENPSVRHLGPTAQDFYAAFGLGSDDRHITAIDESGVALAAIKGLYEQNRILQRRNRELSARLARLERRVVVLSGG